MIEWLMEVTYARELTAKAGSVKLVLTASRRTDMPRFYADELLKGLTEGVFHPQGLMRSVWELRFKPEDIHSIGLWSQDFSRWIRLRESSDSAAAEALAKYRFWYRFTILPDVKALKPQAPAVSAQLKQAKKLIGLDGPEAVTVCIDPLGFYRTIGSLEWVSSCPPEDAEKIAEGAASIGLKEITISLIDYYAKVEKRAARYGVEFLYPDLAAAAGLKAAEQLMEPLARACERTGLVIKTCCEPLLSGVTASGVTIEPGACVDGHRLNRVFGPGAGEKQDGGQRKNHGCLCSLSVDVGRYMEKGPWSHHCGHDCPQCYARK